MIVDNCVMLFLMWRFVMYLGGICLMSFSNFRLFLKRLLYRNVLFVLIFNFFFCFNLQVLWRNSLLIGDWFDGRSWFLDYCEGKANETYFSWEDFALALVSVLQLWFLLVYCHFVVSFSLPILFCAKSWLSFHNVGLSVQRTHIGLLLEGHTCTKMWVSTGNCPVFHSVWEF